MRPGGRTSPRRPRQQLGPAPGQQTRIARAGADQVHGHGGPAAATDVGRHCRNPRARTRRRRSPGPGPRRCPLPSGRRPTRDIRIMVRPSPLANSPWTVSRDVSGPASAQAPTGTVQLPPSAASTARSATNGRCRRLVVEGPSKVRVTASSARHCTAMAPCPAWGSTSVVDSTSVTRCSQPKSLHGGHGHHHGRHRTVLAARHPSLHVAPQVGEDEIGPQEGQLRSAPGRPGGDQPAGGQVSQPAPDQPIAGVGPLGHGGQDEVVRHDRGQVLGRVHGDVGPAVGHRLLHFGHEDALAADLVQRRGGHVTLGAHHQDVDLQVRARRPAGSPPPGSPGTGPAATPGWPTSPCP